MGNTIQSNVNNVTHLKDVKDGVFTQMYTDT